MEFVSFELAKKLKEKGFKEKCIAYYWEKINEHTPSFVLEDNMPEDGLNILDLLSNHNQAEWSPFIDAPTISQVLKWLREEKNIHISPVLWGLGWYADIQSFTKEIDEDCVSYDVDNKFQSIDYETYEEAVIAAIEYVLNNLI